MHFTLFTILFLLPAVSHSLHLKSQLIIADANAPRLDYISEKVIKMLEQMREKMKDGVPELGIPPLDPLVLPEVKLGPLKLGHLGVVKVANFQGIKVDGLPTFEVTGIKANILMMSININVSLATLSINGKYELDGMLMGILPVFGNGALKTSVSDTAISANARLSAKDGAFFLETLTLDASVGHVSIHLENLVGGGDLGDQFNSMVEKIGNRLVKNLVPKIVSSLTEFARLKANEIIKDMDIV